MEAMRTTWLLVLALAACGSNHGKSQDASGGGDGNGDGSNGGGDAGLCAPTDVNCMGPRAFDTGSLIIPMDLAYQSTGMFQAYGLIYQLLQHDVHVRGAARERLGRGDARADRAEHDGALRAGEHGVHHVYSLNRR